DLGLAPHELYLTAEELRARIDALQRVELRALGRTAAKMDQEIALDAELPTISLGRVRAQRKPLFLFPHEDSGGHSPPLNDRGLAAGHRPPTSGIEWRAQSLMRYDGPLPYPPHEVIERPVSSPA